MVQAILPAKLQYRYLQEIQIDALRKQNLCEAKMTLNSLAQAEFIVRRGYLFPPLPFFDSPLLL